LRFTNIDDFDFYCLKTAAFPVEYCLLSYHN